MSIYIGYQTLARPALEELENESWAKGYSGAAPEGTGPGAGAAREAA